MTVVSPGSSEYGARRVFDTSVGPAEAHLFIVNPLRGRRSGGSFSSLFMTHPPTARRIERLEQIATNPR